jgi:hypothetical protein
MILAHDESGKLKLKQPDLLIRLETRPASAGNELDPTGPDPRPHHSEAEASVEEVVVAAVLVVGAAVVAAAAVAQVPAEAEQARGEAEQAPGPVRDRAQAREQEAAVELPRRCLHCEQFEPPAFGDSRPLASDLLAASADP